MSVLCRRRLGDADDGSGVVEVDQVRLGRFARPVVARREHVHLIDAVRPAEGELDGCAGDVV